jgi:hypothetical protein
MLIVEMIAKIRRAHFQDKKPVLSQSFRGWLDWLAW